MEAQSLSACDQCGKKFQRKAHLLRHQQQHSGDRPYSCKFCSKTFKRSDVLRDHFSRCDRRGDSAIPNSLERGRKRHACDECSRLKVKCDNNVPCRKCREFGRVCVKTRTTGASSPDESTTSAPSAPSASRSTPDIASSDRNSIGFLLNFPGEADFLREFPKSSTLSPSSKVVEYQNTMNASHNYEHMSSSINTGSPGYQELVPVQDENMNALLSNLEFATYQQRTHNWPISGGNVMQWSGSDAVFLDRNNLAQRAFDIREKLKYAATTLHAPNTPPKEILEAIDLITPEKIAAWTKLYFKHWHKHAPAVHEASFDPSVAALPLVLALMSLGGMYSNSAAEVDKLKMLLDTIEAYIYSIPSLNEEYDILGRTYVVYGDNTAPDWQQHQLEELQGAYMMIVLQYWTGNAIARTRVRQSRFQRIYSIIHHLELQIVQHSPDFRIIDQHSFRSWIRKESYIRTTVLATMLDHAFGIFNNVSPRFQWAEIDLPFPSDDACFKASNYDELIAKSLYPQPKMKIKDALLVLFASPEFAEDNLQQLRAARLTAFDMQCLVHYLYTCVWKSTFSNMIAGLPTFNVQEVLAPFKNAMRNWRAIWDQLKSSMGENEWNSQGFQITAETYFEAVKAIVDIFEKKNGRFPPIPSDCEKGTHLKRILSF